MNVSTAEVCRLLDEANDALMECHRQIEILKAERAELLVALKALRDDLPYVVSGGECECGEFAEEGSCVHIKADAAIARAES